MALSPLDATLLSALFDPSQSLEAAAATHRLSLLDLALWLAQPHIQAQVEQIQALRALQHEVWADSLRREAAEVLREAMADAEDPAERRRCANTLLRAIARPPVPRAARPPVPRSSNAPQPKAEPDAPARAPAPNAPTSVPSPLAPSRPRSPDPSPSLAAYHAALATLRACGYDTTEDELTEDELTDDELDELEDAELDALDDAPYETQPDRESSEHAPGRNEIELIAAAAHALPAAPTTQAEPQPGMPPGGRAAASPNLHPNAQAVPIGA